MDKDKLGKKIKGFRDLQVWRSGKQIALDTYQITRNFPKEETYGLTAQMRRAAVSIPSNIAEGFNRHHSKEYKRFLYIALGSCSELETQLELSSALGFLSSEKLTDLLEKLDHECAMLRNLIKKLRA